MVGPGRHFGIGDADDRRDRVPEDEQPRLRIAEREGHVAGRVAGRRDRADARRDLVAIGERLDTVGDGGQTAHRARREGQAFLTDRLDGGGVRPVVELGLTHRKPRIGESRFVELVQQPPEVVGMPMGEDHVGDVIAARPRSPPAHPRAARPWA